MYVLLKKCKHALLQQTEQRCSCGHARQIPALGRYYTKREEGNSSRIQNMSSQRQMDGQTRQGHGRRARYFTTDKAICARGIERGGGMSNTGLQSWWEVIDCSRFGGGTLRALALTWLCCPSGISADGVGASGSQGWLPAL